MTLQQIRYIIGVEEAGSLNKASEKLFISQPSLTSAVHDVEWELGFDLFQRSSRGVIATERGAAFIQDAKKLYSQYEELIKKHCENKKRQFSVSALYYSFARKAFVEIVKNFSREAYDFAFWEKKASDVIDDVASSKSEIGILYLSEYNRESILKALKNSNLEFNPLTECKAFVYMHKSHPLSGKESILPEELAPYHFVTFDTDDVKSFFSEEVIKKYNFDKAIYVADRATELNLLKQLNGYTFLSGVFGRGGGEDFILIPLKNPDSKISHTFELGYIKKTGVKMDNVALSYIDAIRRLLKKN